MVSSKSTLWRNFFSNGTDLKLDLIARNMVFHSKRRQLFSEIHERSLSSLAVIAITGDM